MAKNIYAVKKLKRPRASRMLDYALNVYRNGKFVICYRYLNWSGEATYEASRELALRYPAKDGYEIVWG